MRGNELHEGGHVLPRDAFQIPMRGNEMVWGNLDLDWTAEGFKSP